MPENDPSAIVIPFGKHRGSTVAELLAKDPAYADWLAAQGWLAQRFAELHAAIVARGAGADDSPEHNRIQVRFLDPVFRAALVNLTQDVAKARIEDWQNRATPLRNEAYECRENVARAQRHVEYATQLIDHPTYHGDSRARRLASAEQELAAAQTAAANAQAKLVAFPHVPLLSTISFEQNGVDALIAWGFYENFPEPHRHSYGVNVKTIAIEIKPAMGDDYPSVMRQMQRLRCQNLLIQTYTGAAVPLPLLRQMFNANQQTLLTLDDVEAEIPNARQLLA